MKPTVTVITATYNSSRTLAWTIQSVLNQDFTDFEYLIVGDACTDNTAKVVADFADPRIRFVNLPKNSGSQAAPNNHGLDMAQGGWIAYLGHDDLWFPWHLSSLLKTATAHNASFAYGMSAIFSPQGLELVYGVAGAGRTAQNYLVPPSSWLHRLDNQRWRDPDKLGLGVDNDFLMRWAKKHTLAGSKKLSVLKYPSPMWRLYNRQNNFPQEVAIKQMLLAPQQLEYAVLAEAACLASQLRSRFLSPIQICKEALKPLVFYLFFQYPEFFILRWYFQWQRTKNRSKRGLPTNSG
jgi:glycosyltransferase involved in cell wall biosynthesis